MTEARYVPQSSLSKDPFCFRFIARSPLSFVLPLVPSRKMIDAATADDDKVTPIYKLDFMDLFEGLPYIQEDLFLVKTLQDQRNSYWPMMHGNSYKFGLSGSIVSFYYNFSHLHELNDYAPRLNGGRRVWESPLPSSDADLPQLMNDYSSKSGISRTNTKEQRPWKCIDASLIFKVGSKWRTKSFCALKPKLMK